ncbi:MAG: hypothetical protein IT444_11385 [Phycisphaeraceae bacterium]|nr:hypothetical protein [Phycisphaeraceae bacterium]
MPAEMMQQLAQFGVAGLMGVLWVWERLHSRRREEQLSEAHERILSERQELHEMVELVRRNIGAIERFEQTQTRLQQLLERMHDETRKQTA